MDVPVALGVLVTFVASTGATFDPDGLFGHEVYFDSLTMFVSFLLGGRLLETRARHQVAQVLEATLAGMPETALRLDPRSLGAHEYLGELFVELRQIIRLHRSNIQRMNTKGRQNSWPISTGCRLSGQRLHSDSTAQRDRRIQTMSDACQTRPP
mgnify:CR=1 FL=1